MFKKIVREITPLTQSECFTIVSRKKTAFDFPLHTHDEPELNLIVDGSGAQRVIGDHVGEIGNFELVLIGSDLPHCWFTHCCNSGNIYEVTIQFHKDLLSRELLQKNQLAKIRKMFEDAKRGLLFSPKTVQQIAPRIINLDKKIGFDSVIELLSIFDILSNAANSRMLSSITFTKENYAFKSQRLEQVFEYMHRHFARKITLTDVSKIAHMSADSFSRFIKLHTGHTFTENLTDIRLGHVSRMLIDTTYAVGEIAWKCGFRNMANFNRIFRERKGCTPKAFKRKYTEQRMFV